MAQLTDDCFVVSGPLLPVATVEDIIRQRIAPVAGTEQVALADAFGRVTAQDVVAPINLPPFDNSAVDGYAVRHADLAPQGETRLPVAGRVVAGRGLDVLAPGTAVRIFTGAPMPQGADTVFMQEDCSVAGDTVVLPPGLGIGANRRQTGEDVRAGAVALPAGRRLGPADVALAAALGLTMLPARRRVRVALFSTGNEIIEPGCERPAAALYDSNRMLLSGLLAQLGAAVTHLGILPDDVERLAPALQAAATTHDLVLTSGGVSVGELDHVREAVARIGRLVFWRVGIKPGRPVAMGVLSDGKTGEGAAFVGLPGNPVAAFVTFLRVVRPLLLRLAGAEITPLMPLPVRAAFSHSKKTGRREYLRVSLRQAADGTVEAVKFPRDGAGILTSLTRTDGLAELMEGVTAVSPGDTIGFLSYATLAG